MLKLVNPNRTPEVINVKAKRLKRRSIRSGDIVLLIFAWSFFGPLAVLSCVGASRTFGVIFQDLLASGDLLKICFGIVMLINPLLWLFLSIPFYAIYGITTEVMEKR